MSAPLNKATIAGDVSIDDVTIITTKGFAQTITPQVVGMEIYEDVFSSFITGKVFVRDSQELSNTLPLIGEEVVRISVSTPYLDVSEAYTGEFFIYKMSDRESTSEREIVYVLHFISKEAVIDLNKQISKAYGGKVSDIVKTLVTNVYGLESKKRVNIEETNNQTKFVSNFWSPTKCIQYACDTAVNLNNSPSYVFFENKYGLNFVSLESLYVGSPIKQRFVKDNYTREIDPASGSAVRDINKDYQRIIDIQTPETFDYMDRLKSGMYGSELITYDILTKQYTHLAYKPTFKDSKHLNDFPLWTDNPLARPKSVIMFETKYYNNFDGFDDVTNSRSIQKRRSLMAQAEAHKITITVMGRTDYSAGQRVYVELFKKSQIKKEQTDVVDKTLSGNYLVAAICHRITRKDHQCTMELINDSYMANIHDTK